jgi:hypothetical protein
MMRMSDRPQPFARRFASLCLAAVVASSSARAVAQGPEDPAAQEGVQLRREGRDAEALAVFERALAIDGSPRTRAQVALAEQALGFWVEAERDLVLALQSGEGPWFVQHQGTLRAALESVRAHLGTLQLEADAAGIEIRLNGAVAGATPLTAPLRVASGTVTVELRSAGFQTATRVIEVAPGTIARESFHLAPAPSTHLEATRAAAGSAPSPVVGQDPLSTGRATSTPRSHEPTGAWGSLGASAAFLTAGVVAVLVRNSNAALYDDDGRCFYGGLSRDQRCGSYRDAASTAQTLSFIALGAAAVGLGVSVFLFVAPRDVPATRDLGFRCTFGIGAACRGTF